MPLSDNEQAPVLTFATYEPVSAALQLDFSAPVHYDEDWDGDESALVMYFGFERWVVNSALQNDDTTIILQMQNPGDSSPFTNIISVNMDDKWPVVALPTGIALPPAPTFPFTIA